MDLLKYALQFVFLFNLQYSSAYFSVYNYENSTKRSDTWIKWVISSFKFMDNAFYCVQKSAF